MEEVKTSGEISGITRRNVGRLESGCKGGIEEGKENFPNLDVSGETKRKGEAAIVQTSVQIWIKVEERKESRNR